jgi:hypothetical protein
MKLPKVSRESFARNFRIYTSFRESIFGQVCKKPLGEIGVFVGFFGFCWIVGKGGEFLLAYGTVLHTKVTAVSAVVVPPGHCHSGHIY